MKVMNNEEERLRIGNRIKEERERMKLSYRDLSELSGVTPNNIWKIEKGKYNVGFDILCRLAKSLNCQIEITRCV